MFSLQEKVAIITGGNGGIGKSIARVYASLGANVVIGARNEKKTRKTIKELERDYKVNAVGIAVDVRIEDQIERLVAEVIERMGVIDILVNNSGIGPTSLPEKMAIETWDEVLETNLRSAFLLSRAVYPYMKEQGGGKIINVGSMLAAFGTKVLCAYAASKAGIVSLTRSLAVSWAKDNIQVNALMPGWVRTELTHPSGKASSKHSDHVISKTPMGRWGAPEDMGGAAVFLASSASGFVTGIWLPVDGGYSISG